MSSEELEGVIDYGNKLTGRKYYTIAITTVFFYDFLLTLADEIKYAWQGKKSWVFAIFVVNRYLSVGYQIWLLYTSYSTKFHQRLCDKTAFIEPLVTLIFMILAQLVLTLRIYAMTSGKRIIALCFVIITTSQLGIGLYVIANAVENGSLQIIPIPLPGYIVCTFDAKVSLQIGFVATSLAYDFLAFSVIVSVVVRSGLRGVPIPSISKTITRDATYYFLVIFTSHLLLVIFLALAREFPHNGGNLGFIPVMITRLLLSLKKAGASREDGWSFGEPTTRTTLIFAHHRGGVATRDEIPLDTFVSTQERTQGPTDVAAQRALP